MDILKAKHLQDSCKNGLKVKSFDPENGLIQKFLSTQNMAKLKLCHFLSVNELKRNKKRKNVHHCGKCTEFRKNGLTVKSLGPENGKLI